MGWFANIFIVIGMILVGNKYRHAFALSIAGEAIWTFHAYYNLGLVDLAAICGLFCIIAGRNWWKWTHPKTEDVPTLHAAQARIFDLLLADDGQAWKEARKYLELHRPDLAKRLK